MIEIISREDLWSKIEKGDKFKLLDVRDTPDYKREHIVGALHVLIAKMDKKNLKKLLSEDDLIITYSKDVDCPASGIAAVKLQNLGYKNVLRYRGGWQEWKNSNLPTE